MPKAHGMAPIEQRFSDGLMLIELYNLPSSVVWAECEVGDFLHQSSACHQCASKPGLLFEMHIVYSLEPRSNQFAKFLIVFLYLYPMGMALY